MFLEASDKVNIAYDWYPADKPAGYLVLVHMMSVTKESWKEFAEKAAVSGFASIAIDLRGHGQSQSGPNGYEAFADEEHQQSMKDIEAAVDFLKANGASPEKITLVGASIGANLCLWYLAEHPEFKKAVLLSAGESYRGIKTIPLLARLAEGQSLLMFASEDDVRIGGSNADANRKLLEMAPARIKKKLIVYPNGGHGTSYLNEATEAVMDFLKS